MLGTEILVFFEGLGSESVKMVAAASGLAVRLKR